MKRKLFLVNFYLACLAIFFVTVRLPNVNFRLCDFFLMNCLLLSLKLEKKTPLQKGIKKQLLGLTWLFLIGLFISALFNGNTADGLLNIAQYMFVFFALPYLFTFLTREELITALKFVVVSFLLTAVFGIYVFYVKGSLVISYMYNQTPGDRVSSFLGNANTFSRTTVAVFILCIYLANENLIKKSYFWFCSLVCVWSLFLSSSFGGFIILFMGLFLYFFDRLKKLILYFVILGALVLAIPKDVLTSVLPPVFQKRMIENVSDEGLEGAGSFKGRTILFAEGLASATSHPVIGIGPGSFNAATNLSVHNAFLIIWLEGGILSLLMLFLLFLILFKYSVNIHGKIFQREKFLIISMLGCLFISLNTANHFYGRNVLIPLLFSIYLYASKKHENDSIDINSDVQPS